MTELLSINTGKMRRSTEGRDEEFHTEVDCETPNVLVLGQGEMVYVLDVGTSTVLETHRAISRVLNDLEQGRDGEEIKRKRAGEYGIEFIEDILIDLTELQEEGLFTGGIELPRKASNTGYELVISTFHGCNLGCKYCFSQGGKVFQQGSRSIRWETACRGVDYFIKEFAREARDITINFTADGEAMLNFKLIQQLTDYCRQLEEEKSDLKINIGFVTNATVLNDDQIDYLRRQNVQLTFSVDGPQEIHDRMRPFAKGGNSYATVINNIGKYAQKTGNRLKGAAVLTEEFIHFEKIVDNFIQLGFARISAKPPRPDGKTQWAVNARNLEAFKHGYNGLVNFLLRKVIEEDDFRHLDLIANRNDYLGRFIVRLIVGARSQYRCKAAFNRLALAADGNLYPCQDFIGVKEMKIGDVENGVCQEMRERFLDTHVDQREPCKSCFARYLCGGGCYAAAYRVNGDIAQPDKQKCEIIRHLVRLTLYLVGKLQRFKPEAIERLHRKFSGLEPH